MKQVILISALILSIVVTLISCVEYVPSGSVAAVAPQNNKFQAVRDSLRCETDFTSHGTVVIIVVDGCEYIIWTGSHGEIGWTHKGNCTSCRKLQRQLQ
jgi:hypothetical protein